MKKTAIVCCLLISLCLKAQDNAKPSVSKAEWDQLDKAFINLFNAVKDKDFDAFKKISLPIVDCYDCVGKPEFNEQGSAVTADVFFYNIAGGFTKSQLYKALTQRGYTFSISEVKDFTPKYMPKAYTDKDLVLYEVWVPTYLKDELAKGNPGSSHGFQFVKINGEFKFYGLTSIP